MLHGGENITTNEGIDTEHKLSAVLFADITGYTAIMQEDEIIALRFLSRFKESLEKNTELFGGRIVQYFGDGCLMVFESVVAGVDCAIAIQHALRKDEIVPVRIGIHLGEVIYKYDNAFGDGVNIASRIESLGQPGAVLVSKTIYDQVKNKEIYHLVSVGKFDFKNVKEKMEVFAIANTGLVVPRKHQMQGKLKPKRNWLLPVALLSIIAFVLVASFGKLLFPTLPEKSIAVLPFKDLSLSRDQEYLADGISEELLNLLANIPELKVIGRTSSFAFKGKPEDVRAIGNKLDVAHVLEGSIQKDGSKVKVTAQLVKTSDGTQLWSQTFLRDMSDIFKLESEIATSVVQKLRVKLLNQNTSFYTSSNNTKVHNLVLQGNFFQDKRDQESQKKAMHFFIEAIKTDSTDPKGWAGLAKSYILQGTWSFMNPDTSYPLAESTAEKALKLDPGNVEAYRVKGALKMYRFDWRGAENDFDYAISLQPGYADVFRLKGLLYRALGRYDESISLMKKSIELDPLKPITYLDLGVVYFYAGKRDSAIAFYNKTLELDASFPRVHAMAAMVHLVNGNFTQAKKEMDKLTSPPINGLALVYHAMGNRALSDKYLNEFLKNPDKNCWLISRIYAFRGEKEKAFEWLDRAFREKERMLIMVNNDPLLKNIQSDPRYDGYIKRLNIPEN